MDIDNLTIGEARKLAAMFAQPALPQVAEPDPAPYKIGQAYLFRTVTYSVSGVVARVTSQEIVVTDAAWIADTGRFAVALRTANFAEVEAAQDGEVILGRGAITDAWPIAAAPRTTK